MKKVTLRVLALSTFITCAAVLLSSPIKAQPAGTTNFFTNIKAYQLAPLWRADRLRLITLKEYEPFPEPYGTLGKNHQRFYIHYTSISKDPANPYRYLVQGKTRIGNQVRPFTGTITIRQAGILNPELYMHLKLTRAINAANSYRI